MSVSETQENLSWDSETDTSEKCFFLVMLVFCYFTPYAFNASLLGNTLDAPTTAMEWYFTLSAYENITYRL